MLAARERRFTTLFAAEWDGLVTDAVVLCGRSISDLCVAEAQHGRLGAVDVVTRTERLGAGARARWSYGQPRRPSSAPGS
ncbi:hypothetical protein OG535_07145 [Kitasatospora sp. NBC_00085]|uniref:hypothetical protein n=1 Tax=Kitasatospora sp. NBC_00085 TaxID=2903566 RepID=UPI0032500DFC